MTSFNNNLRRIRTNQGLSQSDLARIMNVTQATISSWEKGRTEPSMGDVSRLANILDCSISELTGLESASTEPRLRSIYTPIAFDKIIPMVEKLSLDELLQLQDAIKVRIDFLKKQEEINRMLDENLKEYKEQLSSTMSGQVNRLLSYSLKIGNLLEDDK